LPSLLTAWHLVNINCHVGILTIIKFPTLYSLCFCILVTQHLTSNKLIAASSPSFSLFVYGAPASNGPGPPHYRGFTITLIKEPHNRWDYSVRVTSPAQRTLTDNTQHLQKKINAPGGIQTHIPSRRAAADQFLRPCGHGDRPSPNNSNY